MKKSLVVPLFLLLLGFCETKSNANPVGGAVQAGSATIAHTRPGWLTVNQASDKVIIDWNSFSIGAGEVTRFIQPGANSAALNRVLGGNPTAIYGLLQGNGQIFVINPAGIFVGRSGVINTHSFAGSTLDVTDASFLSGVGIRFSGNSTAAVRNEGNIVALGGDIFLFAHRIENAGSLTAGNGTVGLGAGSEVLLRQSGTEKVSVLAGNINAPATATGVNNSGAIQAASAELKAAGGNIYALAINNGGIVRANTVVNQGGHIYLRASGGNIQNSGTLDASGHSGGSVVVDGGHNASTPSQVVSTGNIEAMGVTSGGAGGKVEVLGDRIGLFGNAVVDVSGQAGGGSAIIGGDIHGANPGLQRSQVTEIDSTVRINADALSLGNGGKITVWSDDSTWFLGSATARGGAQSGSGGFLEISGKGGLVFNGNVDAQAPHGSAGTLLFDPASITIHSGNGAQGDDSKLPDLSNATRGTTGALDISQGKLEGLGANVNIILEATGDITMQALSGGVLNLNLSPTHSLTMNADTDHNGVGNFSMATGDTIQTKGGDVSISGAALTIGSINTSAAGVAGGAITLSASGALSVAGTLTSKGGLVGNGNPGKSGGDVDLSGSSIVAQGAIDTSGGAGNANGAASQPGGDAGAVSMSTTASTTPANSITVGGAIVTSGGAGDAGGTAGNPGTVSFAANTLNLNGAAAAGSVAVPFNTTVSSIVLNKTAGNVVINETDGVNISGTLAGAGEALNLTAHGSIGESALVSVAGASKFTITAAASDFSLGGFANLFSGGVTLAVSGGGTIHDFSLRDATATPLLSLGPAAFNNFSLTYDNAPITLPAVTLTGDLSLSAKGAIKDAGNLSIAGTTTLNATGAGNDITLTKADSFQQAVTVLNGNNVTLDAQGSINLGPATIAGTLNVTAGNNGTAGAQITQSGLLSVGGMSTFNVAANNSDVLVGSFANLFHGVTLTAAGGSLRDVSLWDAAAAPIFVTGLPLSLRNLTLRYDNAGVTLPALNLSGDLAVTAKGLITDGGTLTVAGKTTLAAGAANNITLNTGDGFVGAVTIVSGNDVTINDVDALNFGASTISGNLVAVAGGSISQSGLLDVSVATKTASFTAPAGSDVLLGSFANVLGPVTVNVSGAGSLRDLALRNESTGAGLTGLPLTGLRNLTVQFDNAQVNLPAVTLTGNLSLTGNGISDLGNILVGGSSSLISLGTVNDIVFNHADDFAGGISVTSGRDVTLNETALLSVGGSVGRNLVTTSGAGTTFNALQVNGNLNTSAHGLINDLGVLKVFGSSLLAAGVGNDILLTQADLFGGPVGIASAQNVTLNAVGPLTVAGTVPGNLTTTSSGLLTLNPLSVGGNLDATAGGINGLASLMVNGTTKLTAGAANNITLSSLSDDFVGPVNIVSGKNVTLSDINALTVGGNVSGNLSISSGGPLTFNTLTVGANLNTSDGGLISDAGPVKVVGSTSLASGTGNNISLSLADDFVGPVSILSGKDVALNDINSLTLGASTVSGNLTVTAAGPITQSGALVVNTAGAVASFSTPGKAITLNDANDFFTAKFNGSDVTLNDINLLDLGASAVTGDLKVSAGGAISQSGALIANGAGKTANFASPGNLITLGNPNNDFTTVSFLGSDVIVNDVNAVDLGASTASGNLTVTAGGTISQSGVLDVSVAGKVAAFIAPAGADVLLGSFANKLGSVTVGVNGAGSLRDLALRNISGGAALTGLPLTGLRNLTVEFDSAPVVLPAVTLSGNLVVTGTGISDIGNILVAGSSTLLTLGVGSDIILNHADDFGGGISVTGTRDVTLNDISLLKVGGTVGRDLTTTSGGDTLFNALQVAGNLKTTALGAISDAGVLNVSGSSIFSAGIGKDISLTQADIFGGPVGIASAQNATVNAVGQLTLGGTVVGNLTATPSGALTLNSLNVGNNLNVTAGGLISDAGSVKVGGATSLVAGGNNINLSQADDFTGPVNIVSGNDVTLNDINALTVGGNVGGKLTTTSGGALTYIALNVAGNLSSSAGGLISDAGAVKVGGTTSLAAGGNNIALSLADDFVGPVTILSGNDVALNDINTLTLGGTVGGKLTTTSAGALTLNALTVGNNLDSTAGGLISDAGTVKVGGTTSLTAGGNNITLSQADDFVGAVNIISGNDVALNDINTLTVGGAVGGKLTTTSGGALTFNALNVANDLSSTAGGLISDAGAVKVGGVTSLTAGGNNINLSQADDFVGAVNIVSGNDVALNDINTLTVGGAVGGKLTTTSGGTLTFNALNVANDLSSTAGGLISDAGVVKVGGVTSLTAGGNNINLSQADDFVGAVNIVSGNDVALNDINTLTIGGTVGGKLTTTSGGALTFNALNVANNLSSTAGGLISDAGVVKVGGVTSLTAGGNNITLSQADDFVGSVGIVSGNDVTLNDINTLTVGGAVAGKLTTTSGGALTLNALTVGNNLNSTAGGLISDAGAVKVAGTATLTAGGNNITLSQADDFVGPVNIVSGNDVALNDINTLTVGGAVGGKLTTTSAGALTLNALTVGNNLDSTAGGLISDAGAVKVGGTTSLTAGGNNITLSQADDFVGPVNIVSGNDVALNDINTLTVGGAVGGKLTTTSAGALTLNALTVGNNLDSTAGGLISDAGAVKVGGTTSLTAGGNNITLSQADDFVGAVNIVSGNDVALNDINTLTVGGAVGGKLTTTSAGALTLNALTVGNNLDSTAGGLISDAGAVKVGGTTSLTAGGNNITLSQADDFVGAVNIVSGNDVALNDINTLTVGGAVGGKLTTTSAGALTLNALTVGNNLDSTAGGLISDAGAVKVGGTTSLTAGGNNITLSQADDFVGAVNIVSGNDVALNDINTLTVGGTVNGKLTTTSAGALTYNALTVGNDLNSTAGGLISDSGAVKVGGVTSLTAGGNNITLSQADDFVGAVNIVSGNDVALNDINTLTVGGTVNGKLTTTSAGALTYNALTVGNDLNSTAGGLISDAGTVKVGGVTSLTAGGNNITLSQADDFVGAVNIVSGNDVALNDINTLTVGGTVGGKLTTSSGGALTYNALNVGGNLSSTAGGLISDAGAVKVGGSTSLTAGGNNITLSQADDFVGPVNIVSGNDVALNDVNTLTVGGTVGDKLTTTSGGALTFNALSVGSDLNSTAGGLISDAGAVNVGGATTLTAGGNNITLSQADDFVGPVNIVSGNDVALNDINTLTVGGTVAGKLTTTSAGALTLNALTIGNDLNSTAGGLISDAGAVNVGGATTLTAGGNNITLSQADDFVGAVNIVSGNDVALNDINTLTVGGTVAGKLTTTSAGALTLNALTIGNDLNSTAGGLISDAGAVKVGGVTSLTAGGNNITLSQADDFVGAVNIVSGNDVALNDINTLTVGGTVGGKLTTTSGGALTYNALIVGGNLSSSAGGLISDAGAVKVGGVTSLTAGGNNITLSQADDFVGAVNIVSGNDVALNDINTLAVGGTVNGKLTTTSAGALTYNALTVGNDLNSTAGGLISDAGAVKVGGVASLTAGGNNITLSQADDFVGAVNIVSGNDVALNDINTLTVGGSVGGKLTTTTGGALTFNALSVASDLNSTAGGLISDAGAVSVGGATTLTAGANNITLSQADDFVGPVSILSGKDVSLNDVNALTFGASTVSGDLTVTAGGPIAQTGPLSVNGAGKKAFFNAAGNNITLLDANNDFTTAGFNGVDVGVNDVNALDLGASTIAGNLAVTAGGPITQSGTIIANAATKTAAFSSAGNSITLTDPNNDFSTARFTGSDVSVIDVNALDLGASTLSGNLTVAAGGPITQSGALTVNGAGKIASFSAPGNSITLGQANNDFSIAEFTGSDVSVNDVDAIDLGLSKVTGNLTVTANGAITQSGVITANGAGKLASFTAGAANDVTLGLNNEFASVSVPKAKNVTLRGAHGFILSAVDAAGTLNLNTTAGDIIQALDGTFIKAQTLSGVVNGSLILGNTANASTTPGVQFVAAPQPQNQFGSISSLSHNGELYIFNSRTVHYGDLTHPGEIANPVLLQDPTAVLGLKITGPVSGEGLTTIRTEGDLVLLGNGRVTTTKGDIELSAESTDNASGNFHNLAGTIALDGTPVPDSAHGKIAVQAGTDFLNHKPGATRASRFLIFSTDAKLNFGETFVGARLTFNGLGADFLADQITFNNHRSPIIKQNAQADNDVGNGFVFVQKQAVLQSDETAKFFFDLLTVAIVDAIDATAEVDKLPPERPPTIWTSSYHVYLDEQEKKKKKKKVVQTQGALFAAGVAGQ